MRAFASLRLWTPNTVLNSWPVESDDSKPRDTERADYIFIEEKICV